MVAATLAFAGLHRRRAIALSGIAMFAIAILIAVPIPVQYFDRLQTIRNYEEVDERSALSRIHFWKVALAMAADHPLGVGLKNYQANYDRYDFEGGYFGNRRDVHSTHLQVLAETGYGGFLIYVSLLWGALVYLFRVRRRARDERLAPEDRRFLLTMSTALIASLAAFVVGGTFNSLLVDEINWYTFALIAALDLVSRRMVTQARSRTAGHATAA
jgi:O-antigen ligase